MKSKWVFLGLSLAACGSESSIVGGQCRSGFAPEGHECVAIQSPSGPSPSGPVDTILPSSPIDETPVEPPPTEPTEPTPPVKKPDFVINGPKLPDAGNVLVCAEPLVLCRGECISVDADGQNCGACGKICPSNICLGGVCQGATPGDVVLVGHDFSDASPGSAEAKLFANALTISSSDPVRVLSWRAGAKPAAFANQKTILEASGRHFTIDTAVSDAELASATLAHDYDVVLVDDAAGDAPAVRGASWANALGTFVQKGGSVVFLDGGSTNVPELVASTGLLGVAEHTKLPPKAHLVVTAPGDVVGTQLVSPYASFGSAVSFGGVDAPDADVTWVVRSSGGVGDPVVVHRIVR